MWLLCSPCQTYVETTTLDIYLKFLERALTYLWHQNHSQTSLKKKDDFPLNSPADSLPSEMIASLDCFISNWPFLVCWLSHFPANKIKVVKKNVTQCWTWV